MTILRIVLLCLLAGMGLKAQAQRTLVPIVSFHDIPVTVATQARLTNDDVKNAFLAAGEEAKWQIVPTGDGVLEATYVKQNKHTIMVTIRYDAQKYSVLFKGSDNMKQRIGQPMSEAVAAAAEQTATTVRRSTGDPIPEGRSPGRDPSVLRTLGLRLA